MSPPSQVSDREPAAGRLSSFVAAALFVGTGLVTLAAVALLPEYVALADLTVRCESLARHRDCERRLAIHNERFLAARRSDPVLASRLLIRHGRYHPVGVEVVEIPDMNGQTVPEKILRDAAAPPPLPDNWLYRAGRWIDDSRTSTSLLMLALGAIAVGVLAFPPPACKGEAP